MTDLRSRLLFYGALTLAILVGWVLFSRWVAQLDARNRDLDRRTDAALAIGKAWRTRDAELRVQLRADSIRVAGLQRQASQKAQNARIASQTADSARTALAAAQTTSDSLTAALAAMVADSTGAFHWRQAFLDQVAATAVLTEDLAAIRQDLGGARRAIDSLSTALVKEQGNRHGHPFLGLSPTAFFVAGVILGAGGTATVAQVAK